MRLDVIYCEDCLSGLKRLPDACIDLIVTDPPFDKNYPYRMYKDKRDDYWSWLAKIFLEIRRVLKPNSSIYVKQDVDNIFNMMAILNLIADYRNIIIWKKQSQAHPKNNYDKFAEIILFYTVGKPIFNTWAEKRPKPPNYWSGKGKPFKGKMWNYWDDIKPVHVGCVKSKEAIIEGKINQKVHRCQMPIALAERCIKFSSNEGDVVLDPFIGSGTTAVAAKRTKRHFIGFEIDEEYVRIANERLANIQLSFV